MRVWDVAAGYLNRQSLLAEHRELHGLHSILVHGKKGYSRHPETLRWVGCLTGLQRRHDALVAEMILRGYVHRTPLDRIGDSLRWPAIYVTEPGAQFALLKKKYVDKEGGRIALPKSVQELWASHKYSVMARDPGECRTIGRRVASMRRGADLSPVARDLVEILRRTPGKRRLVTALEHMWGHVSKSATVEERRRSASSMGELFDVVRGIAVRTRAPYLTTSTALSEIAVFVDGAD